jgi:hypothetical protein
VFFASGPVPNRSIPHPFPALKVENPHGVEHGVTSVRFDGKSLLGKTIDLVDDGDQHVVLVSTG